MAVSLQATIQVFNGLSTDDKPATAPEGSTFHAVDTGEQWVLHDDGWVLDLRMARAVHMSADL